MIAAEFYQEVVINVEYGGFCLSKRAWDRLLELGYRPTDGDIELEKYSENLNLGYYGMNVPRNHPILIQVVKELGPKDAGGKNTSLKIVNVKVSINVSDDDGKEHIEVYGGEVFT